VGAAGPADDNVSGNIADAGENARGRIDCAEEGSGPTVVLVPGSWGRRSARRAVMVALDGRHRFVTTSLLGYGGSLHWFTAFEGMIAAKNLATPQMLARYYTRRASCDGTPDWVHRVLCFVCFFLASPNPMSCGCGGALKLWSLIHHGWCLVQVR
jgi:pimeloyl-ACP methyl ester carboxylesterase